MHMRLSFVLAIGMVIFAVAAAPVAGSYLSAPASFNIAYQPAASADQNVKSSIAISSGQWVTWQPIGGENISMLSPTDGWMADFEGKNCSLYRWNGSAWNYFGAVAHPDYVIKAGDIQMVSPTDGWLMFYGDLFDTTYHPPKSVIYRWNGSSWNFYDTLGGSGSGIALSRIGVISGTDIWATAATMFGTKFYHWNGSSWTELFSLCCDINLSFDIEMVSSTDGWAVGAAGSGNSNIVRWNGSEWDQVTSPTSTVLQSIAMVSDADGWIVGRNGTILRWNNVAWSSASSPVAANLNSIKMLSATNGWAVGDSGVILHWDGDSWSQVSSPTLANLNEIAMLSANDGWIAGNGVTLRFVNLPNKVFVPAILK